MEQTKVKVLPSQFVLTTKQRTELLEAKVKRAEESLRQLKEIALKLQRS